MTLDELRLTMTVTVFLTFRISCSESKRLHVVTVLSQDYKLIFVTSRVHCISSDHLFHHPTSSDEDRDDKS